MRGPFSLLARRARRALRLRHRTAASIVRYGALETIPITVAGLAAGMWEVLAVGFERMGRRPVTALALVNVLNAADLLEEGLLARLLGYGDGPF